MGEIEVGLIWIWEILRMDWEFWIWEILGSVWRSDAWKRVSKERVMVG